jgi:hypothetical protein
MKLVSIFRVIASIALAIATMIWAIIASIAYGTQFFNFAVVTTVLMLIATLAQLFAFMADESDE